MADFTGEEYDPDLFKPTQGTADAIDAQELAALGTGDSTTYVMFGIDGACAPGTAPTTWEVVGTPDPLGVSAPSFPCGGPWTAIWIGFVK